MTRIAVRRGLLVVALLGCAACVERRPILKLSAKTFTFTTQFDAQGCPTDSLPSEANCVPHKRDAKDPAHCVYVSKQSKDEVKFRPKGDASDPQYQPAFDPRARLVPIPDVSKPDGKHWDLLIDTNAPEGVQQKFTLTSTACPTKPLDPTVIVGP